MLAIDTVWRTLNKNNKKNSSKIENLTERRSYYYKLISILPLRNNCSQLYKKKIKFCNENTITLFSFLLTVKMLKRNIMN